MGNCISCSGVSNEFLSEFLTKVATQDLPPLSTASLSVASFGFVLVCCIVASSTRTGMFEEVVNWKWALLSESLTTTSLLLMSVAMAGLDAATVSSLAAIQPMLVVILEFVLGVARPNCTTRGVGCCLLLKVVPILAVLVGVVLLSMSAAE